MMKWYYPVDTLITKPPDDTMKIDNDLPDDVQPNKDKSQKKRSKKVQKSTSLNKQKDQQSHASSTKTARSKSQKPAAKK